MITEDFNNKLNALFPEMTNANTLGSASGELWKGVSEKYADGVAKIIAPIKDCILDVQTDLQVRNPDACPVVQVEVIESMGDAMIDGENWNTSDIKNKYVDVKLHRVSRPFKLTAYDIMRGERVESKVKSAMEAVAQGVNLLFMTAVFDAFAVSGIGAEEVSAFGPEKVAEISGIFGSNGNVETLILSPVAYSKIVPTNGLGLNPETKGVYGIGQIYKGETAFSIDKMGTGADYIALGKGAIVGAVATPEILFTKVGQGMQYLGEVAGIPMVLISDFDYNTQTVKCSVETLAGFNTANAELVRTGTITK